MRTSHRIILSFASALAFAATASAQYLTCTAFVANQPTLREEGLTEAAGDILIYCTTTQLPLPGAAAGPQTLSLYVNGAQITSRQLYSGTSTPSSIPTDAALLVNDNVTGSAVNGASAPTQGFLQNGALVFSGFTLPASCPGGATPVCSTTNGFASFTIRITNLRVNANELASGSFVTGTVLSTFGLQNQQNLVLGAVQSSLSVRVSTPVQNSQQCGPQSVTLNNLTVSELQNTAFKVQSISGNGTPGQWYQNGNNGETQTLLSNVALANTTSVQNPGTFASQLNGVVPGQVDAGTRLRVNIFNVPGGVSLSFPVTVSSGSSTLVLTSNGDVGPFNQPGGNSVTLNASGSVTYEVRAQNPGTIDSFTIPITVTSNNPGAGTILVSATFAPTSAESFTQIPRFADTSQLTPLYNLVSCLPATHLSFSTQPANGMAGIALAPVGVSVLDVNGNVTASSASLTVTSNPGAVNSTVSASGGVATFNSLVFGSPGTFTLSATSSGLAGATSVPFVIKAPPTVTFSSSSNPVRYGQTVTLTALISPSSATGVVSFYDGVNLLGTAELSSGQASFTTSLLPAGSRSLRARYLGNTSYLPAISPVFSQGVNATGASTLNSAASLQAGVGPSSVVVADFNGDGVADLAVANYVSGNVSVLLGTGNGIFQQAVNYTVGNQPLSVAAGDVNGDGKMDLVVANSLDGTLSVLLGKGDGTFQPQMIWAAGGDARSVTIGDFNNDGITDLAVTNYNSGTVSILIGTGNGAFVGGATAYNVAAGPNSAAVGDFNGDGVPDLAVACTGNNSLNVLLGNGDGTFQNALNLLLGSSPQSVAVGDFNGDGRLDVVTANAYGSNVSVLLGDGTGLFETPVFYSAGSNPFAVTVGDVNGDGRPDLVIANVNTNNISVLYGNGNGTFQAAVNFAAGSFPQSVALADFNGDGRTDVVVANYGGGLSLFSGSSQTATQLKFTTQPSNGGPNIGPVMVQIQDAGGNLVSSSNASVTLTSNPAGVSTTVNAVNGVATFSNLVFNTAGTYTLTATSTGLPSATSNSFNVVNQLPSVAIDSPAAGAVLTSNGVTVSGWAIDNTSSAVGTISSVKVTVDGTL
ncbi:MAG TPA: FG-GAP-like repeat-containing protein, partial [Bryobacteraceae bacterium]